MYKPVYFEEYKSSSYWAQQRKGHPIRDRIMAIGALTFLVAGDMLTSLI